MLALQIVLLIIGWLSIGSGVQALIKLLLGYDQEISGVDALPIIAWPMFLAFAIAIAFAKTARWAFANIFDHWDKSW